jgi:hypothetical protein
LLLAGGVCYAGSAAAFSLLAWGRTRRREALLAADRYLGQSRGRGRSQAASR